ncbi:hypothetical protein KGD83_00315 [Nocardiopsis akebiae]|uniref:Uncharacterized protein n=2 Tax=Nocardiopsis akebiae TaxID=2831968 RepID=A0ABX8CAT0_9ACTN|nr:hypothetical protein KGD83_00315 [Nocardiopsis akebiae]
MNTRTPLECLIVGIGLITLGTAGAVFDFLVPFIEWFAIGMGLFNLVLALALYWAERSRFRSHQATSSTGEESDP